MIQEAETVGATTLRAIADHLNQSGATTARGKAWTAVAVQRVMERAQPAE